MGRHLVIPATHPLPGSTSGQQKLYPYYLGPGAWPRARLAACLQDARAPPYQPCSLPLPAGFPFKTLSANLTLRSTRASANYSVAYNIWASWRGRGGVLGAALGPGGLPGGDAPPNVPAPAERDVALCLCVPHHWRPGLSCRAYRATHIQRALPGVGQGLARVRRAHGARPAPLQVLRGLAGNAASLSRPDSGPFLCMLIDPGCAAAYYNTAFSKVGVLRGSGGWRLGGGVLPDVVLSLPRLSAFAGRLYSSLHVQQHVSSWLGGRGGVCVWGWGGEGGLGKQQPRQAWRLRPETQPMWLPPCPSPCAERGPCAKGPKPCLPPTRATAAAAASPAPPRHTRRRCAQMASAPQPSTQATPSAAAP